MKVIWRDEATANLENIYSFISLHCAEEVTHQQARRESCAASLCRPLARVVVKFKFSSRQIIDLDLLQYDKHEAVHQYF